MLTITKPSPEDLLQSVTRYWDKRATGYNETNQSELSSLKREVWKALILSQVQTDRPLNILDVGCGPGFFSIIMAEAGNQVTAVDSTRAMLDQAEKNAQEQGLHISFIESDAHNIAIEDASYDLVISRNLTWNLYEPVEAYKEWFRLLKPGGKLLNFDANWYLHLFDEVFANGFEEDRKQTKKQNTPDHYVNTDTKTMTEIALQLPLSQILRPQWDVSILKSVGFTKVGIDTEIGEIVWDDEEKLNYKSTPMFMIAAQK